MLGSMGLVAVILAGAALIVWIVVLVWLSERILRFIGLRTAWGPLDPRNLVTTFLLLGGAIHLANFLLDRLDNAMQRNSASSGLTFPGAFLIASVALAVGIAAVRWRRKQGGKK